MRILRGWLTRACAIRAVTHAAWQQARHHGREAVSALLTRHVVMHPVPYHSWPLPLHVKECQERAVKPPAPRASIYGCAKCRSGLFVGHSVGGKKCEALGKCQRNKTGGRRCGA